MADPIIIIKENPGTLTIEVLDGNRNPVGRLPCPTVSFTTDSELDIDGSSKAKVKPKKVGNVAVVEIKIGTAAGG